MKITMQLATIMAIPGGSFLCLLWDGLRDKRVRIMFFWKAIVSLCSLHWYMFFVVLICRNLYNGGEECDIRTNHRVTIATSMEKYARLKYALLILSTPTQGFHLCVWLDLFWGLCGLVVWACVDNAQLTVHCSTYLILTLVLTTQGLCDK